jgi:hypothetical protein
MMPDQIALFRLREATVQQVQELIWADRRIMTDSVATALECSHGLAYNIMHGRLKFQKCEHAGCPENWRIKKINQMDLSLQHLLRYADEGEDMLHRIVTGDESWAAVHRKFPG